MPGRLADVETLAASHPRPERSRRPDGSHAQTPTASSSRPSVFERRNCWQCPLNNAGAIDGDCGRQLSLYLAALLVKIAPGQHRPSCSATSKCCTRPDPGRISSLANHHAHHHGGCPGLLTAILRRPINGISKLRPARPIGLVQGPLSRFGSRPRHMRCILHAQALSLPNSLSRRLG